MQVRFSKYEGLGNDFLVIDEADLGGLALTVDQAVALCDRHRGVGGDGVLVVGREPASMRVINADGSVPEMCGNGVRCVALHIARLRDASNLEIPIDTAAGPQRCAVERTGNRGEVTVQMSGGTLAPEAIGLASNRPWKDEPMEIDGRALQVTAVSMGNPHAVIFNEVGDARFALGERFQQDPRFGDGVNVGFVSELAAGSIRLDVLERGAGWTQACGTGAAAAVVAAAETDRLPRHTPIAVQLPGGTLTMTVGALGDPVTMTGPARFVFSGEVGVAR